jgi:hypothetical protein
MLAEKLGAVMNDPGLDERKQQFAVGRRDVIKLGSVAVSAAALAALTGSRLASAEPAPVPLAASTFQVYSVGLDWIQISNTRSRFKDTVFAAMSLSSGMGAPVTETAGLGNLDEGSYSPGLRFGNVAVRDGKVMVLHYNVINDGSDSSSVVRQAIDQVAKTLAQKGADAAAQVGGSAIGGYLGAQLGTIAIPIVGTALGALAGWLVGKSIPLLFPDCDGYVAAGVHAFTSQELRSYTAGGHSIERSDLSPGTDSPAGCGSNSEYTVAWSIDLVLPNLQSDWRWCSRCQGMFFCGGGELGRCPAGGQHTTAGSGNYVLQGWSGAAALSPGQRQWQWCNLCQGLWFDGALENSWCPYWTGTPNQGQYIDGGHNSAGSGEYVLADASQTFPGQDSWRYCSQCQGLFFGENSNGRCAAGGPHRPNGSGNYRMRSYSYS